MAPLGALTASTSKRLFQFLEPVPESFPAPQNNGDDHNVHVIDQVCGEELTDGRGTSADAYVQPTSCDSHEGC